MKPKPINLDEYKEIKFKDIINLQFNDYALWEDENGNSRYFIKIKKELQ